MFTGLITDVGRVADLDRQGDLRVTITTGYETEGIPLGASVACNGICLTVVDKYARWLAFDASAETVARTTVGSWALGTPVNLERSLRLGDELGGHLVYGHVDGVAEVVEVTPAGDSHRWVFRAPPDLAPFLAPKGSVALDGISLTVNDVVGSEFSVMIIPHTRAHTNLGSLTAGSRLNMEVDMLARYVARLMGAGALGGRHP